jgi:geranylgeranyl reductase
MLRTKVLVIGGGPAGSTASRMLAREGVDTLLVERNFSFVKPCGGGFPSPAFGEFDIPTDAVKMQVDTVKIVSPTGEELLIPLSGGTISIVDRSCFDPILRKKAAESGATLLEARFVRFKEVGKTMTAEVATGEGCTDIRADYVIAADGVNSRVRAALDIRPAPSFLTMTERRGGVHTDLCEFWFGSSHAPLFYSWVFPTGSGISVGTGSIDSRAVKTFLQLFIERRGLDKGREGAEADGQRSLRTYKIPLWLDDLYHKGRVLFAGDAAGQVMPMSYEGIYYAMKSGEFAARAILNGKMRDYRALWRRSFLKSFSIMKRIWEHFVKNDERADRLVQLLKKPQVQNAAIGIWLKKDLKKEIILSYISLFKKFLG